MRGVTTSTYLSIYSNIVRSRSRIEMKEKPVSATNSIIRWSLYKKWHRNSCLEWIFLTHLRVYATCTCRVDSRPSPFDCGCEKIKLIWMRKWKRTRRMPVVVEIVVSHCNFLFGFSFSEWKIQYYKEQHFHSQRPLSLMLCLTRKI